jgi:hypothetical protein
MLNGEQNFPAIGKRLFIESAVISWQLAVGHNYTMKYFLLLAKNCRLQTAHCRLLTIP